MDPNPSKTEEERSPAPPNLTSGAWLEFGVGEEEERILSVILDHFSFLRFTPSQFGSGGSSRYSSD